MYGDTKGGDLTIASQGRGLDGMIELAFEGRRFLDVRRWKDAIEELNKPVRGMDMEKSSDAGFYLEKAISVVRCDRKFEQRNYLFPIPKSDMDKNSKLVQNPGW